MTNWNDYFYYDETSPSCLRWNVDVYSGRYGLRLNVTKHSIAGHLHSKGYWIVSVDGKNRKGHRVVYEMHHGALPRNAKVDHENGDKGDNRVGNLREATDALNSRNKKRSVRNVSGVVGVSSWTCGKTGVVYWKAAWYDLARKGHGKCFSTNKYGTEEAFRLACEYRSKMIAELNEQGAGYTETHGVRESQ